MAAVEPVAVFRHACQVNDTEVRRARLLFVGVGLAEIVNARPDELAAAVRIALHPVEHLVNRVKRALEVARVDLRGHALAAREVLHSAKRVLAVEAAGAHGRRGLREDDRLVRILLLNWHVGAEVVPSRQVERVEDAEVEHPPLVHERAVPVADRTRGIGRPHLVAEELVAHLRLSPRAAVEEGVVGLADRMGRVPLPDFGADGPHDHRRVVSVALHERRKVPRHVFLQRLVVAPPAIGVPLVEAFVPHENAHFVAEVEQLGRGRVVAGAQGVRAHLLHETQLPPRRRPVERHAKEPQV